MEETHTVPEQPAVPPTPPVPLRALLAREDLALRQIGGPADAGTVLHGAHVSEMADPYPYLLGGELLLTAGVHFAEADGPASRFDDYVGRIVAAGGAALGFGVAPVHDTVPGALVEACDAHGLPLVEVAPRTTFAAVARAVWQLMERARTAELRRVTEAQQGLAAAASRPDPVPSVLRQLARRVGGRAVLYGPQGAQIAAAGPVTGAEEALAGLARRLTPHGPSTAGDSTASGVRLAAYALGASRGFVLGVAFPRREAGDHAIASVAAVLLTLLTGARRTGSDAARSAALVRVLLGGAPEDVAALLGGERWTVVHARADEAEPGPLAAPALGAALGSPLVDPASDVVRVLVPAEREPGPVPGWTMGVSAVVEASRWPLADTQAARALARARATRTALVRHGGRTALAALVPPDAAAEHARALLAPLAAASPALTETLRTWLSLHGSWDRTAVALSVHRNTVRQRIARCAALLDADLDDADVRMELWFALGHG
ncbi:PucR family transcriptional regulator [Streptomyces hilarionis]|uniref:PucR family transcriptional regulator n=1 Tax=Streptomyces hilarionis TaxID=2839954 RepID=UPI002119E260|nr:PucR family transcriptional regulator [Streptomyces hilarionis]MCQ9134016.1 PucR family transcriptional regulator [Streptomyces hilarionis]